MTYDIDCDHIEYLIRKHGIPKDFCSLIYLPLRVGPKTPPLEVDVRDASGSPLSLATGAHNTKIVSLILCGYLGSYYSNLNGILKEDLRDAFSSMLRRASLSPKEELAWNRLQADASTVATFDLRKFLSAFAALTETRVFSVSIGECASSGVRIIKTKEMVKGLELDKNQMTMQLRTSSIGTARSNHISVRAPEGTWIMGMELFRNGERVPFKRNNISEKNDYVIRSHYMRSVLADKNLPSFKTGASSYTVKIHLRPMRSYFLGPHMAVTAVSLAIHAFLVAMIIVICHWSSQSTIPLNTGAFVPVIAIIPTIYAVFLHHVGEHKILSSLQRNWRTQGYLAVSFIILMAILYSLIPSNSDGVDASWLFVASSIGTVVSLAFFAYGFRQFYKLGQDLKNNEGSSDGTW
ncbi:hypothetical protein J5X07_03945 [Actinomyces bowdenii]|uniref:hypothetical protein n=1 Tax=Actinomyces bowdenii TaxID=131109 RepID=UPI001ABC98F8|nr:hypothetical protein [Actinomyces bowdenii]MBO3724188.1 hypothetical protein [Actinomyces bowdenii]